ncbi:MAG TPA: DUF4332 domain-containing protein [Candidatus Thermoplasmatota archaeon]
MKRRDSRSSSLLATRRRFRLIGVVILSILALISVLTAAFLVFVDRTTVSPELMTVFFSLVVVCALLSFGLLYLLLTIERTFKAVRLEYTSEPASHGRIERAPVAVPPTVPGPTIEYGVESRDAEILEGIGSVFSRRLARNGITTLEDLRKQSAPKVALAAQVGEPIAYRWKLMAQLMIVREVNAQAAELLVMCGIESIPELAQESAETLTRKARLVNQSQRARIYPAELSVSIVDGWIQAAKAQTIPDLQSERGRVGRGDTVA